MYDQTTLKEMTYSHYEDLYRREDSARGDLGVHNDFRINESHYQDLVQLDVTMEDVKMSLFDISPYKALGPDGFQPVFSQHLWEATRQDLYRFGRGVFRDTKDINKMNQTFLVLIPKIPNPDNLNEFRPIGFCNTVYRL